MAHWGTFGLLLEDGSPALCVVPAAELDIERTWDVTGMKGSGSDTVVIEDVFVPDRRIQPASGIFKSRYATSHTEEQTARMSFLPTFGLPLIAVQVGLARHALEISLARVPGRSIAYTFYTNARNSPTHQVAIAEAAQMFDLAELLLQRSSGIVDSAAEEGRDLDDLERARALNDIGTITELVTGGLDRVMTANGSSAFTETSVLSRIRRDSEIAARHVLLIPSLGKEIYGQLLLGSDARSMPF